MKVDIFSKRYPIRNKSAAVSMITLGLIISLFGFFHNRLDILLGGEVITPAVFFGLAIPVVILTWTELHFKVFSSWSRLNSFSNQQLLTLFVSFAVIISATLGLFVPGVAEWLGWFNGGVFAIAGLTIILEALR